jgi:assimilatory nitrate reductase electron transfer subunit
MSTLRRVVVVGNGMAGARLVDELRRRDPAGLSLHVTVIGEEPHPAYNRVLLSTVVGGALRVEAVRLYPEDWHVKHQVQLHTGVRVVDIDRDHRTVTTDDRQGHSYDVLVLATGSRSWTPPTEGLAAPDGTLAAGAVAFRTATDCERILDVAAPGARIAVLGGGLLGLEAARGLVGRGADVTVLHPVGHLMERQLDPGSGAVLAGTLRELGVNVRLNVMATRYLAPVERRGLELDDGSFQPADLVVVAAGVRAQTWLARSAGLAVNNGIVVDDELRSVTDRRVRAIGECAEHNGVVHGLVQPAWDQARVVADLLTGADPNARYAGSRPVTRLKARDVDLAAMGETFTDHDDAGADVVRLEDPAQGRYAKLVLRDERVAGAIVLGCPEAAATITQLFDSRAPVPADRLGLLVGRRATASGGDTTPALLPNRSIVCRCNTVTKGQLSTAWLAGARSVPALATATRATTGCGSCKDAVAGICSWLAETEPVQQEPDADWDGEEETVA